MSTVFALPGGLWHGDQLLREVSLSPLTGVDEEVLLAPEATFPSRSQWVSALIARATQSIDGEEVTPALADRLAVGDREALLMQIRRLTMGEQLHCVMRCEHCGERMEFDLKIADLVAAKYTDWQPEYREVIAGDEGRWDIRFRLPTGADQSAVAAQARRDLNRAEALLLDRCVLEAHRLDETPLAAGALPRPIAQRLADRMSELDAQAETTLRCACPVCHADSVIALDFADILLRELSSSPLYREVHVLALHYHWSESEILSLPRAKRQRYLGLLAEQRAGVMRT